MPSKVVAIFAISVSFVCPFVSYSSPSTNSTTSKSAQHSARIDASRITSLLSQAQTEWDRLDLLAALQSYNQLLELDVHNTEAIQGRLRVLSTLGLADEAVHEAQSVLFTDSGIIQTLHEDKAAQAIRWSEQVYYSKPKERYPVADEAIVLVQANLQRYPDSARSKFDWVRALSNRQRYSESIQSYEVLLSSGDNLPAYVHVAAGRAYFAEKKPDVAAHAYKQALAKEPDNLDATFGLFYALSDQGQYDAANQLIQSVADGKLLPDNKLTAVSTAIAGQAYAGNLDAAQTQLQQLQQEVPNSAQLHIALGRVYLWCGWPQLAQNELEWAALKQPDDIRAQNALVEADAALGNYASADQRLAKLEVIAPDDPDIKNLKRSQNIRNYNELSLNVRGTRTKDNAGTSNGTSIDAKYLAPPIGLQTRPFVHAYIENSTVDNIAAEYQRLGIGAEHRIPQFGWVQAEIQQELNLEKKSSLIVGGTWNINDYWLLNGQLDSNSIDVPLRARVDDVSGWKAQLGAGYRAHEGAYTQLDYTEMHMSDQNLRRSVALYGNYTVLQRPSYKGMVGLEWAASNNSLRNTAYFNPVNDNTAQVSYTNEWLSQQSPQRILKQQLVLAVGRYAQDGFDAGTIGSISYQHDWKLSDVAQLRYGVAFVRRVYDGLVSEGPEGNLSFNWRF